MKEIWWRYVFVDGVEIITRGLNKNELRIEVQKHGVLVKKEIIKGD